MELMSAVGQSDYVYCIDIVESYDLCVRLGPKDALSYS